MSDPHSYLLLFLNLQFLQKRLLKTAHINKHKTRARVTHEEEIT